MSTFTIEIKAPELCEALNNLARLLAPAAQPQKAPSQTQAAIPDTPPQAPAAPQPPQLPATPQPPTRSAAVPPVTAPQQQTYAPPTVSVPTAPPPAVIPTAAAKEYTITDFQLACAPLIDRGKRQDIVALIASLGAASLIEMPKERYNDFAAGLRALGGKI